jgi:hypothetical protein
LDLTPEQIAIEEERFQKWLKEQEGGLGSTPMEQVSKPFCKV